MPNWPEHGLVCEPLARVRFDSEEPARLVECGRPFVTKIAGWRALEWDVPYLKRTVGQRMIPLKLAGQTRMTELALADILDIVADERRRSEFDFPGVPYIRIWRHGSGLDPELHALFDDIALPSFIREEKLSSVNIWVSEGFKDNGNHADPNAMANLNLQVQGKKRVWLFSPRDAPCFDMASSLMTPPFVAVAPQAHAIGDHPSFKNARCYETILEPGDAIFIPPLWFHWFVHYPVYQINLNIWWETELQLSPLSATWAFSNALAKTLGGFSASTAAFDALSEDTRQLLRRIEATLLDDTTVYSPTKVMDEKLTTRIPGVPDPSSGEYDDDPDRQK